MEKATIPGAWAEALQKRHEIMVVTVMPGSGFAVFDSAASGGARTGRSVAR